MTTVTVAEARENLVELLHRAAAGEQIVITEDGKWLAALGKAPPPPPTDEEIAAAGDRARAAIVAALRQQIADGNPPPEGSKVWELLAEEAVIARREQIIREWLGLRPDAPLPKPDAMSYDEYLARYREAG